MAAHFGGTVPRTPLSESGPAQQLALCRVALRRFVMLSVVATEALTRPVEVGR